MKGLVMRLLTLAKQVHCWLPLIMIHRIFLLARYWSKRITWLNLIQYERTFDGSRQERKYLFVHIVVPENTEKKTRLAANTTKTFFFFTHVVKYLKDRKHNKLCFPRKHAIFVLEHYLGMFLKAYSLSQTSLSENRSDYRCRITANCTITLSDYNWAEWLVKNKAANAPITF